MNQFYNENTINEDLERELYYTIRDAISQARNAPLPISLAGMAAAIADEIEDPQELTKLGAELDECVLQKIDARAEVVSRKYVNKGLDKLIKTGI